MQKVVLASGNKHKFKEIDAALKDFDLQLIPMSDLGISGDEIDENADTFEGNALIKAEYIMNKIKEIVIADDSGLEVDALDGRPGVYSARYAGENASFDDNNKKLLYELQDVKEEDRGAKFVTALVCLFPSGEKIVVRGEVVGRIANECLGDGGFGYDPIFFIPDLKKTYAQLSLLEKNNISHRAKALEKLKLELEVNIFGKK